MREATVFLEPTGEGFRLTTQDGVRTVDAPGLGACVRELEASHPRWVWDTGTTYPTLLAAGVRVGRAHDLRLVRAILRRATATAAAFEDVPHDGWDDEAPERSDGALFDVVEPLPDAVAEYRRQRDVLDAATPALRLLASIESAGALAAAEMRESGLPWRTDIHAAVLEQQLGSRAPAGTRPERMEVLLAEIRAALDAPTLNPDSPQELVRALHRAGLPVETTRKWELRQLDHAVVEPLLQYKKLARLLAANGWHWLDTWVVDGRFHPDYVVGGVVTGRWATRGAGAMQLPKELRTAVVADPGWRLVVADVAQLEPRVLAGMAGDAAMARAGRGQDLYEGIVASGAAPDRTSAKYGMLGALYGATQGRGGALVPKLRQRFPAALGLVDAAAATGERGGAVTTLLGRTAPPASADWRRSASPAAERERGRFTRNFVVQGTAAEWALCWMADLRLRLAALTDGPVDAGPQLAYFLHDEVVVHTPGGLSDAVADAVRAAAERAGRILFGEFPVDFPLDLAVVDRYADAG